MSTIAGKEKKLTGSFFPEEERGCLPKEIFAPREDPQFQRSCGQFFLCFLTIEKAARTIVDSLAEGFPSASMDRPKLACAIGVAAYGSSLSTARAWRHDCPKQSVCLGPAGTLQVAKLQTSRRFEERHPDFASS